jgi:hypothetical protein
MEQDTFRRSICPCPKEFVGSTREHDRQGVTIKIRKRVADVRPGRGEGLDSIEISKTGRCLQTSTTYGFTKIANYIEDSVKTYDLGMKKKRNKPCSTFESFIVRRGSTISFSNTLSRPPRTSTTYSSLES